MQSKTSIAVFMTIATALLAAPGRAQQQPVTLQQHGQTIQIAVGGKPFTTYSFDPTISKAFLQPLRTADGIVVTRGYPTANTFPAAHAHEDSAEPHQRDMYFGHGNINGYDFWSEESFAGFYKGDPPSKFGRMVFRKIEEMRGGQSTGVLRAVFDLEGPDRKPFAEETQQFTFSGTSKARVIDCVFTFRASHGPITFGDTKEGTFALRLAPQLDAPTGTMVNSEGGVGEPQIWGKRANWVNVDGVIEGHSLGVAVFDNPGSFHHPTYWHARGYGLLAANPFGLSFFYKDSKHNGSYTVPAGKTLQFRYRVLIHSGTFRQADVAAQYSQYASQP